jgi:glucokinase
MYGVGLTMDSILVIDIGATNTRIAVGWEERNRPIISDLILMKTPVNASELVESIVEYAEKRKGIRLASIASIGPLDLRRGWILETPNTEIGPYPIVDVLSERLGVPVLLLNDCQAGVWGEYVYGKYKGTSNMVYITLSSGVGAGAIVDGHLLIGRTGNAHEVGHFVVDYNSKVKCGCGGLGHWEGYVGGKNIQRSARDLLDSYTGPRTLFYEKGITGRFSVEELFNYASKGDEAALYLIDEIVRITAAGVSSVIAAYDPEVILFGGTVYHKGLSNYMNAVERYLETYALHWDVVIAPSTFPGEEPLIGALASALHKPA